MVVCGILVTVTIYYRGRQSLCANVCWQRYALIGDSPYNDKVLVLHSEPAVSPIVGACQIFLDFVAVCGNLFQSCASHVSNKASCSHVSIGSPHATFSDLTLHI